MVLTRAEITKRSEQKKVIDGYERVKVWIVKNPEAKEQLKHFVKDINVRFNCFRFNDIN